MKHRLLSAALLAALALGGCTGELAQIKSLTVDEGVEFAKEVDAWREEIREKREADREARRERIAKRRAEMLDKIGEGKKSPGPLTNPGDPVNPPEVDLPDDEYEEPLDEGMEEEPLDDEGLEGDITPEVPPE